jgi:hypothetical protein
LKIGRWFQVAFIFISVLVLPTILVYMGSVLRNAREKMGILSKAQQASDGKWELDFFGSSLGIDSIANLFWRGQRHR